MLLVFIILNTLGIVSFLLALVSYNTEGDEIKALVISCVCFIIGFICYGLDNTPTAMDVYKGKTTIEVTYRDDVAVDSVVVFKIRRNNYDNN